VVFAEWPVIGLGGKASSPNTPAGVGGSKSISILICRRFSSLVYNYGTKLPATRDVCDDILRRLKLTRYALGHSKVIEALCEQIVVN